MNEKQVQTQCKKLLRKIGCAVYDTSQPFRAKITPGVPDLLVFWPAKRRFFFFEVKKPGAKQTPAQRDFELYCRATDTPYLLGGIPELIEYLGLR